MKNNKKINIINKEVFGELVKEHMSYLHTLAIHMTRDHDEAMDLLQDTLLRAYDRREKYTEDRNFRGWLATIMKNLFINRYRQLLKLPHHIKAEKGQYFINQVRNAKNLGAENFSTMDIHNEIQNLDEKYRSMFLMHFSGFKYVEIAQRKGVPLGTVKHRIHRARKLLKDRLRLQNKQYKAA